MHNSSKRTVKRRELRDLEIYGFFKGKNWEAHTSKGKSADIVQHPLYVK